VIAFLALFPLGLNFSIILFKYLKNKKYHLRV